MGAHIQRMSSMSISSLRAIVIFVISFTTWGGISCNQSCQGVRLDHKLFSNKLQFHKLSWPNRVPQTISLRTTSSLVEHYTLSAQLLIWVMSGWLLLAVCLPVWQMVYQDSYASICCGRCKSIAIDRPCTWAAHPTFVRFANGMCLEGFGCLW